MDCFVCAISSHGAQVPRKGHNKRTDHHFYTHNSMMPTADLVDSFSDDKCPKLRGKPRLFFIQVSFMLCIRPLTNIYPYHPFRIPGRSITSLWCTRRELFSVYVYHDNT